MCVVFHCFSFSGSEKGPIGSTTRYLIELRYLRPQTRMATRFRPNNNSEVVRNRNIKFVRAILGEDNYSAWHILNRKVDTPTTNISHYPLEPEGNVRKFLPEPAPTESQFEQLHLAAAITKLLNVLHFDFIYGSPCSLVDIHRYRGIS